MRRRVFLARAGTFAAGVVAASCRAPTVRSRVARIGAFTSETRPSDGTRPSVELDIMDGLREQGLIHGQNIDIEWRHAEGKPELLPVFANEFVRRPVDILIASTTSAARAAKAATASVPIVMQGAADALDEGIVSDYAHPGANITGTALASTEEAIKRVELLHDVFPAISRVLLIDPRSTPRRVAEVRRAAESLGINLVSPTLRTDKDIRQLLEGVATDTGLVLVPSALIFQNTRHIITAAAERRIPVVYSRPQDVHAGGLMSYGADRKEVRRAVGPFIRRILDGAAPGDLPVYLPQRFEFVVNTTTVERAGWRIPASILLGATEIVP